MSAKLCACHQMLGVWMSGKGCSCINQELCTDKTLCSSPMSEALEVMSGSSRVPVPKHFYLLCRFILKFNVKLKGFKEMYVLSTSTPLFTGITILYASHSPFKYHYTYCSSVTVCRSFSSFLSLHFRGDGLPPVTDGLFSGVQTPIRSLRGSSPPSASLA